MQKSVCDGVCARVSNAIDKQDEGVVEGSLAEAKMPAVCLLFRRGLGSFFFG